MLALVMLCARMLKPQTRVSACKACEAGWTIRDVKERTRCGRARARVYRGSALLGRLVGVRQLEAEFGGDIDFDDQGGVEVPVTPPRRRTARWATIEKDADDEPEVERAAASSRARSSTGSTEPKSPSRPAAPQPAPSSPWASGSRLRPPELDDADRAQLDRSERLRHPDGRELTVDEHLLRMRELECFTRDEMAGLLMDLRFPGEDITAAMNAGPVERLRRLSGGASTATAAPTTKTTVSEPDDPVQRDALRAVEWAQRYRKEREEKERKG